MWSPVLFVSATLLVTANASKLPAAWKTCPRNLPRTEYDTCIKNAVKIALTDIFANGIPSINIPPLEPFKIPVIEIGKGNGPVAIEIKLEDVEIANVDSVEIKKIRFDDIENYRFGADVAMKEPVILTAKYEIKGKVLLLPITGKGDCRFQIDNFIGTEDFSGVPFTKGEKTYMNVTQCILKFSTDKLHVKLDNLFNGNKALGDNMNVFLNENWSDIFKELQPAISETLGQFIKSITSQIFSNIPYNQIFRPS